MNLTKADLAALGTDRKGFDKRCEEIKALLMSSDKAVEQAILRIYDRQWPDEKATSETKHDNGIGFQQCDAKAGSFYARLIRSGHKLYPERMLRARRMAVKYRRQLACLSFLKDQAKLGYKSGLLLEQARREGLTVVDLKLTSLNEEDLSGSPAVRHDGKTL